MINKYISYVFLTSLSVLTLPVASAATDSSFSIELGSDNNDGDERYLDLSLGLGDGRQLFISQGESTTTDSTGELKTNAWSIGMSTDPAADFGLAVYYSYWGDKDALEIDTLALDLNINTDNWAFVITPQTRDIVLVSTTRRNTTFSSQGLGLSVDYYGIRDFYFSVASLLNSYPSNLSLLADNPLFSGRNFSSTTLDNALGLEDNRTTLGMGYSFGSATAGIQHTDSVSAVDDSNSTTDTIYLSWNMNQQWRLKLSTGTASTEGNPDDTRFTNMAVTYRW
ncbi:MAG: hypothetical protein OEY89_02300 [Gammaproteobacteria bacterium]|nr:hypothetical protein [Gammaproteobacteria bacterium]